MFLEDSLLGGPLDPRRGGWLSAAVQQGPILCVALALVVAARRRGWVRAPGRWPRPESFAAFLVRGVPVVDARTVAIFRIVFAAGLVLVLRSRPIPASWLTAGTYAAVVCFGIGLYARAALAVASAGMYFWMTAYTAHFGSHPVATLVVALPCMCPVRWSDALGVDAWLRGARPGPPSRAYGYAIWAPLLVVAVALHAAAWAKLLTPEWIANGTVRYAFVADYHRASVDWGLWIASHPAAAVAASAAAVVLEAVVITAAFAVSWKYRLAVGAATWGLFAGFYLLQGELWLAWWLLLSAFLPWPLLTRQWTGQAAGGLTRVQWAAAALVVLVQVVASVARLEIAPAISAYDMYSTTFKSPRAFDRANPMYRYRFEAETASGRRLDVTDCFDRPATPQEARVWGERSAVLRSALEACELALPPDIGALRLYESLQAFDWEKGEFYWRYRDQPVWGVSLPAGDVR